MSNSKLLKGKVCLITGTSRGIGRAIAERFAEEGAIVYANARNPGSIDDWAKECSLKNLTTVTPVYFDVTDYGKAKQTVLEIVREYQHIDILVNNAGIVSHELIGMIKLENMRNLFEVNVVATVHMIQLVSRVMSRKKNGSIINISSIVGVHGYKGQLAYSATKGAVISLTKSAAKELSSQNIRVNSIAPGMIETEMSNALLEKSFQERLSNIGFKSLGKPVDIANACVFLGSDLSSYISGQVLGVDGCSVI